MSALSTVKLVLLGNAAVGKSSILQRFSYNTYDQYRAPTVGAAFTTKVINILDPETKEGRSIKFDIWDTAGQEKYRSMTPLYYRNAYCAIVVYDVIDGKTFEGAKTWISEIREMEGDKVMIALCGNKYDLGESHRQVLAQTAKQFADENRIQIFLECSAKTGFNIQQLFYSIGECVPKNFCAIKGRNSSVSSVDNSSIHFISDDVDFDKSTNKCCKIL